MYYSAVKPLDVANGTGVRVSLFVSGCRNRCPGCFNPETWDFTYGKPFDEAAAERILALLSPGYVSGLTLLGGEPFEPENQPTLHRLLRRARDIHPDRTIWCYTGCVYERDLLPGGSRHTADTAGLLSFLEVLVDGPFIQEQADISLRFRGSRNQRLLDMPETLRRGQAVLWRG